MRVLLVDAYPASSKSGQERFARFRRHVQRVLGELQRMDVTRIELIVSTSRTLPFGYSPRTQTLICLEFLRLDGAKERHRSSLDEFLYELRSEFADPTAITRFDQLDFVLVDGDGSSSPWAPSARKLALLVKMCMMTGKCLFAAGLGASLLAYVCATGGELLRVLNNNGKGSLLDTVHDLPPPPSSDSGDGVLLDVKTGDYFTFDGRANCWIPKGNTGLVIHSSDDARSFYGARPNSARAGGVSKPGSAQASLCLTRRGEERCCARLEVMKSHAVLRAALTTDNNKSAVPSSRELVLRCTSRWDIDEEISSTSANRFRVLVDSARGPMLLEFGNCLGTHFELDARAYPASFELLHHFMRAKNEEFKVHAHLDRSYVAAISGGNSRLRERLVLAQNKRAARPLSAGSSSIGSRAASAPAAAMANNTSTMGATASNEAGMSPGRTSPKRCRPVSAGPHRSTNKANSPPRRTIQTSRSVYPSVPASTSTPVMALGRPPEINSPPICEENSSTQSNGDKREYSAREGWKEVEAQPETEETSIELTTSRSNSSSNHEDDKPKPKPRIVRVPQKNELEKPYCAFAKRREEDQQQHQPLRDAIDDEYYSVVNDAPYVSAYEREMLEQQRSKLKWMAGPFRAVVGKASTQVVPEVGLFARGPFVQKNMPHYIIQRRTLEEEVPKAAAASRTKAHQPHKSKAKPQRSPPNNRKR